MGNMVTNIYAKFNFDRFHIEESLWKFRFDNNKNNKNKDNVRGACGDPSRVQKSLLNESERSCFEREAYETQTAYNVKSFSST